MRFDGIFAFTRAASVTLHKNVHEKSADLSIDKPGAFLYDEARKEKAAALQPLFKIEGQPIAGGESHVPEFPAAGRAWQSGVGAVGVVWNLFSAPGKPKGYG